MPIGKITIKTGPPVEGNEFFGRDKEIEYAWKLIQNGNSLLLSAPRRVGKSSFSKRMLRLAEESEWKTLYLDLQGIGTEEQFFKLFAEKFKSEKFWKNLKEKTGSILNSIEGIEISEGKIGINRTDWRSDTYTKVKTIIESTGEILIVMDELAIFLDNLLKQDNGKERTEFFLNWLRSFRQISGTKVHWIFCSSIGIENFASIHGLSHTINDIHPFPLDAFLKEEAREFITKLNVSDTVQFDDEIVQYILDKLSWHLPFFIQILIEKIDYLVFSEEEPLTTQLVDKAYALLLTEKHFNTWDERLREYHSFEDSARKVLKLCAIPEGRTRGNLLASIQHENSDIEKEKTNLAQLLAMLQNDGYLMLDNNNHYVFRSPLLRDFWNRKFVL